MNFQLSSSRRVRNGSHTQLCVIFLVSFCLFGTLLAQTFIYSRGWTNGKKRSSMGSFKIIQDTNDNQDVIGICQMQRLKEILESRRIDRDPLPCEIIEKPEIDILDRFRRKSDCEK